MNKDTKVGPLWIKEHHVMTYTFHCRAIYHIFHCFIQLHRELSNSIPFTVDLSIWNSLIDWAEAHYDLKYLNSLALLIRYCLHLDSEALV